MTFNLGSIVSFLFLAAPLLAAPTNDQVERRDALSDATLSAHNAARAQYGANALTWNPSLYAATLAWAQACNFQHSTPNGAYGENLAASTSPTYNVQNAVNDWMGEAAQYNYNNPGFSSATGHFTQVVWKATTQVACAVASCPADKIFPGRTSQYVVCRYTPPGNYNNQFALNVGRPAGSTAPTSTSTSKTTAPTCK